MIILRKLSLRYPLVSLWLSSCRAMSTSSSSTTTTGKRRIAAIAQLRSTTSKMQNLLDTAYCARLAKANGASMLFLPECFGFMGTSSDETLKNAEQPVMEDTTRNDSSVTSALHRVLRSSEDAPPKEEGTKLPDDIPIVLLDGLKTIAKESGLWISGGGMHVLGAPTDEVTGKARVYNTHVILNDSGTVQCLYRKIHLFDVSIPGKVSLRESATTAPGTELVVCDSPLGKLGLSTCYDVRFPEMYLRLVEQGAQILLVPSAFTVPTGTAHWHILLQARAIENQSFVIAAAQYGKHNDKRESYGHSLAVNPWGKILADAGGYGRNEDEDVPTVSGGKEEGGSDLILPAPSIVICEIDLDLLASIRQRMPLQLHRENAEFS